MGLRERRKMKHDDVVQITQLVTEPLRMELHFEIYRPSLGAHPFFELYMVACPYVTKRVCHTAMSMMLVATGDVIFHAGEIPTKPRMYIVNNAFLNYRQFSQDHHEVVEEGSWIAEAVLWIVWTHRGMLTAAHDCCLYPLDAEEFQGIASHFEYGDDFDPRIYAESLINYLNSLDQSAVSDVMHS